eukprot:4654428-Karenia_brevis.AAC.1
METVGAQIIQAKTALANAAQNRYNENPAVKAAQNILAKIHLPEAPNGQENAFLAIMKSKSDILPQGAKQVVQAREDLDAVLESNAVDAEHRPEIETMLSSLREVLCVFALIANLRTKVLAKRRKTAGQIIFA